MTSWIAALLGMTSWIAALLGMTSWIAALLGMTSWIAALLGMTSWIAALLGMTGWIAALGMTTRYSRSFIRRGTSFAPDVSGAIRSTECGLSASLESSLFLA